MRTPSEAEVAGYFEQLCNWGRWGEADELGTLNFVTAQTRREALASAVDGVTVCCAAPIEKGQNASDIPFPPLHFMIRSGESLSPLRPGFVDFIGLVFHGLTTTHIDALGHSSWRGKLYNGTDITAVTTGSLGATSLSVDAMRAGIVTRGVLLDIAALKGQRYLQPGDGIFPEDLDEAERAQDVQVRPGDALLVRTGWWAYRAEHGPAPERARPGLHAATLPWLHERSVSLVAADAGNDVVPSGYESIELPVHEIGQAGMGLCLIDACQFDELAAACRERSRYHFLFSAAPLRIKYGTGSPINPVAIL